MNWHGHAQDDTEMAFHRLSEKAMQRYVSSQRQFAADIATYAQWHIEDETAQLAFTSADQRVQTYALTAVATYSPRAQDIAWAWANAAFDGAIAALTPRLRGLYDVTQYGIFHTPSFIATPSELDTLCALALWHLQGKAIFKVKDPDVWVCYVVHEHAQANQTSGL